MNILQFCHEKALDAVFRKRETWFNWFVLLGAIYAVPIAQVARLLHRTENDVLAAYQHFTTRHEWPSQPSTEAWILSGRKSGKSRIVSVVIAFEMLVRLDWQKRLTPGERCVFPVVAVDRQQARIIFEFVKGILYSSQMFKAMIVSESKEEIELDNGAVLRVMVADKASSRGPLYGCLAADEVAFWKTGDSFVNPDHEVFSAIEPGIVDGGLILSISSVAGEMGLLYEMYRQHYAKDNDPVLVWKSKTIEMNPLYSQNKIDRMLAKDQVVGRAEYYSEFRSDLSGLYSSVALEDCRMTGRQELQFQNGVDYRAFVDMSGSKKDSHSLAISHGEKDGRIVVDIMREIVPQANIKPSAVVHDFAEILRMYHLRKAVGDAYGAAWVEEAFSKEEIRLERAEKNSSEIYLYCVGPISDRKVELPDSDRLLNQLRSLMRRIVPGGRDKVLSGKADRSHSDLSNAVCGSIFLVGGKKKRAPLDPMAGAYFYGDDDESWNSNYSRFKREIGGNR